MTTDSHSGAQPRKKPVMIRIVWGGGNESHVIEFPRIRLALRKFNQAVGVYVSLFSLIRRANAFNPRCTATFTADLDIPVRTAASLTLNPSSFTY